MFPDGIVYDRKNDVVRTSRANSIFELTRSLLISLNQQKSGQKNNNVNLSALVIATGFEPVTVCLEGRCSIQLSYATIALSKRNL